MYRLDGIPTEPRRPRDEFEAALFRRVIEHAIRAWRNVAAGIDSDGPGVDGVWRLSLTPTADDWPFDPATAMRSPQLEGRIWLVERDSPASEYYRVAVVWAAGDQTNIDEYGPVVNWEHANPAGPWLPVERR